jgi:uncharacterized protein (DUF1697 family)
MDASSVPSALPEGPMTVFVALLRAINVGGTGTLSMKELSALCADLGLKRVRTYIQSGNVVFESLLSEAALREKLEQALTKRMEKRVDVVVRTASELRSVVEANPFPDAPPAKVAVFFRSDPLPKGLLDNLVIPGGEEVRPGRREIYVHYPNGMGRSKLRLSPSAGVGTVRNMNTVAKLVAIATA